MADKQTKTAVVVSAHSADFVWRAGGAIALYAERGWEITVVCLSFGERGESAKLWRNTGMTIEKVKAARQEEAERAADVLGARTIFFDAGDYPMRISDENLFKLAALYRDLRPEIILTHSLHDPYNFDHPLAARVAQEARIVAPGNRMLRDQSGGQFEVEISRPHRAQCRVCRRNFQAWLREITFRDNSRRFWGCE